VKTPDAIQLAAAKVGGATPGISLLVMDRLPVARVRE